MFTITVPATISLPVNKKSTSLSLLYSPHARGKEKKRKKIKEEENNNNKEEEEEEEEDEKTSLSGIRNELITPLTSVLTTAFGCFSRSRN